MYLMYFLLLFRASYLVDAPFNPESSHHHQYFVGLPLSSNNFFLWSIFLLPSPPPNSQLYDRGCDLFLAQNNNFQTYSWPWTVSGSLESLYILPLKYFPWVKQTNAIREILVYGKIPKWILLDIVCILNIIFQNEIDVVILSKCERNNFTLFLWNKCSHNLQIYVDQGT